MTKFLSSVALALPLLQLAACAEVPRDVRDKAELARFEAYAGAPVREIAYMGRYQGWKPLSRAEFVLWTTPWQAYLIKVEQPCADMPLSFSMSLNATEAHVLQTGADTVKTQGWTCPIEEIRPVDYRRMQADLKNQAPAAPNAVTAESVN